MGQIIEVIEGNLNLIRNYDDVWFIQRNHVSEKRLWWWLFIFVLFCSPFLAFWVAALFIVKINFKFFFIFYFSVLIIK